MWRRGGVRIAQTSDLGPAWTAHDERGLHGDGPGGTTTVLEAGTRRLRALAAQGRDIVGFLVAFDHFSRLRRDRYYVVNRPGDE